MKDWKHSWSSCYNFASL